VAGFKQKMWQTCLLKVYKHARC